MSPPAMACAAGRTRETACGSATAWLRRGGELSREDSLVPADLLTFWFSMFGTVLAKVPDGRSGAGESGDPEGGFGSYQEFGKDKEVKHMSLGVALCVPVSHSILHAHHK